MVQDGDFAVVEVTGGEFQPSGIPVLVAVCETCGFVRLFASEPSN